MNEKERWEGRPTGTGVETPPSSTPRCLFEWSYMYFISFHFFQKKRERQHHAMEAETRQPQPKINAPHPNFTIPHPTTTPESTRGGRHRARVSMPSGRRSRVVSPGCVGARWLEDTTRTSVPSSVREDLCVYAAFAGALQCRSCF